MPRKAAPDLERLLDPSVTRLLLSIADTGSFSVAATTLGVSQPAVSQQVRRVERMVGRPLFRRTRRGVVLTTDGQAVVIYARAMLGLAADLRARLDRGPGGTEVAAGMSEDFCRTALPSVLRLFALDHPAVRFRIVTGTYDRLSEAIETGAVSFAIMRRYERFPQAETLYRDRLAWIGGLGLRVPVADPVPLVLPLAPSPGRDVVLDCLRAAGRDCVIKFESVGIAGMEMALGADLGVCAGPPSMILLGAAPLADGHGLPPLPPVEFVIVRGAAGNELARAFTEFLRLAARDRFLSRMDLRATAFRVVDPVAGGPPR